MTGGVPTKPCEVCGKVFAKLPCDSVTYWPKKRYCSLKCYGEARRGKPNPKAAYWRGQERSPEMRVKVSEGMKRAHVEGRAYVIDSVGLRREETSQWKGDDIKYRAAHSRLDRYRGRPGECEHCGTVTARKFEWALRHDAEVRKADETGRFAGLPFSPRPSDYLRLCTACHHEYDGRERDADGRFS